jgi:multiple sugar transport system permease protein
MKTVISLRWAPYFFLSPFLVLFLVFGIFPLLFSLVLAFQSWDPVKGMDSMQFIGLENFNFLIQDEWFWKSLYNTLWLAFVSGIPQHLVAIPLAAYIHRSLNRTRNLVVGIYFIPYITSTVAMAILFSALFSTDYGVVNSMIAWLRQMPGLGLILPSTAIDWLGEPSNIKPAISLMVFWRYVGFNTVLYLAAMQAIPKETYEAARLDGASTIQQFFYITLPLLKPMMFFSVTLSVIGGLQLFEEPFVLTGGRGGSDQAGMTTAMYMYRTAFEFNDFGTASAISWALFFVVAILTWVTHRLFSTSGRS